MKKFLPTKKFFNPIFNVFFFYGLPYGPGTGDFKALVHIFKIFSPENGGKKPLLVSKVFLDTKFHAYFKNRSKVKETKK